MPQAQWPKVLPRTLIVSSEDDLRSFHEVREQVFHVEKGNRQLDFRIRKLENALDSAADLTTLKHDLTKARDQTSDAIRRLEGRVDLLERRVDSLKSRVVDLVALIKLLHEETCNLCSDPGSYAHRQVAVIKTFVDKVEEKDIGEKSEKE